MCNGILTISNQIIVIEKIGLHISRSQAAQMPSEAIPRTMAEFVTVKSNIV